MFAASKTGSVVSSGDPYWSSVSLLTNFENNLTFQDGSTNNFAITRNGVVNPSLNTPFSGGVGGSEWLNGSTGYLIAPDNAALNMGTSDFTLEAWIYLTATPGAATNSGANVINKDGKNAVSWPQYTLYVNSSLKVCASFSSVPNGGGAPTANITGSTTLSLNTWYHVAVTRIGVNGTVWVNGTSNGTTTSIPSTLANGARALYIGYEESQAAFAYFPGFISNARIVKGTAVYTTGFTPPTAPLTAITNTSLLITGTGQGMFNNSTFVDQGPNALTVTATGSPVYSGLSPFGNTYPGSVLFNGTTQYLTTPNNAVFQFGTGDFTAEAWVYLITKPINARLFSLGNFSGAGNFQVEIPGSTGNDILIHVNGAFVTYTYTVPLTTWFHIAVCRISGTVKVYINGSSLGSNVQSGTVNDSTNVFAIGSQSNGTSLLNGYVSNARIVKGTAVYTANFTPSTTPLTAITNTSLLVRGDTGAFYDLSNNGNAQSSTGTTAVTTQVKKYGAESASYTATAYQTVADAVNLQLGTGDYTIEMWVYRNAAGVLHSLICKGAAATGWLLQVNSSNQLVFTVTSTAILTSTTTIAATTWTFVTVTRSGTSTRLFIGGNLEATATDSTNFNQTNALLVGADRSNANGLNGYLDDIRITKGVARYTATFTPPAVTFPTGP